ncbi:MAG: hypothetical protein FJ206_14560 [Gemmatimonadetes bacterium]|nr:hypothetical protein [Gemmatimonadota bacterium]
MIPTVIGELALLATLGGIGLGLSGWLFGRWRRIQPVRRAGGWFAAGLATVYGLAWLGTVPLGRERLVPPGGELSFCGLDCHLHVGVTRIERGANLGVTVRFRSDARRIDEYPQFLRFEIVDQLGRRWSPADGFVAETLPPGGQFEKELVFSVAPDVVIKGLAVHRPGFAPDYLLAGLGNPLVQRRLMLTLGN